MTKKDFIEGIEEWSNHRFLLWQALELTKDSKLPVAEFGAGDGSTKYLRSYCNINNREFISYENVKEWADKCGSILVDNWETADIYKEYSVVLIDNAGWDRHKEIAILKDKADILVVHDSEQFSAGDYKYDKAFWLFKYRIDLLIVRVATTMLSNKINFADLF